MFPGIGFCKGLLRFVICVIVGLSDLVVVVVRFLSVLETSKVFSIIFKGGFCVCPDGWRYLYMSRTRVTKMSDLLKLSKAFTNVFPQRAHCIPPHA